jgi:hypothetical protein
MKQQRLENKGYFMKSMSVRRRLFFTTFNLGRESIRNKTYILFSAIRVFQFVQDIYETEVGKESSESFLFFTG